MRLISECMPSGERSVAYRKPATAPKIGGMVFTASRYSARAGRVPQLIGCDPQTRSGGIAGTRYGANQSIGAPRTTHTASGTNVITPHAMRHFGVRRSMNAATSTTSATVSAIANFSGYRTTRSHDADSTGVPPAHDQHADRRGKNDDRFAGESNQSKSGGGDHRVEDSRPRLSGQRRAAVLHGPQRKGNQRDGRDQVVKRSRRNRQAAH